MSASNAVSCELVLNLALAPPWVHVFGTLVEAKMCMHNCTFTLESTHFIFNKCPIYNHDGANVKFSTNSHEMDYSVMAWNERKQSADHLHSAPEVYPSFTVAPQFFPSICNVDMLYFCLQHSILLSGPNLWSPRLFMYNFVNIIQPFHVYGQERKGRLAYIHIWSLSCSDF